MAYVWLAVVVVVANVGLPLATWVMLPPTIANFDIGDVVPTPKLPATVALPPIIAVPVAVRLAAERLPEKSPLPLTERICDGEVVPIPKRPAELITDVRTLEVL